MKTQILESRESLFQRIADFGKNMLSTSTDTSGRRPLRRISLVIRENGYLDDLVCHLGGIGQESLTRVEIAELLEKVAGKLRSSQLESAWKERA